MALVFGGAGWLYCSCNYVLLGAAQQKALSLSLTDANLDNSSDPPSRWWDRVSIDLELIACDVSFLVSDKTAGFCVSFFSVAKAVYMLQAVKMLTVTARVPPLSFITTPGQGNSNFSGCGDARFFPLCSRKGLPPG